MVRGLAHAVRPGGLSEADRERIAVLAERRWSAARIAREIEKHPSTVGWFMYRAGLRAPSYRHSHVTGVRKNGRVVKRFERTEDDLMVRLRREGQTPARIAEVLTAEFGHPRSGHTVACRLVMLAAIEGES